MIYDIIDEVLPVEFNDYVCAIAENTPRWSPAGKEKNYSDYCPDGVLDFGNMIVSYNGDEEKDPYFVKLNILANSIAQVVISKHKGKFEGISIKRIIWNRYPRNGYCGRHQDLHKSDNEEALISIVYHLNDNDGYNIVNDQKIDNLCGRAIIFQSTDWHEGRGPFNFYSRCTLNVVCGYKKYTQFK